jgi:hypothetical protein
MLHYTPIEQKVMDILRDGKPHHIKTMCKEIDSEFTPDNLGNHIRFLRKKLKPFGKGIVCTYSERRTHYQLVS